MMKYNEEYYLNQVLTYTFPYRVYSNQHLNNVFKTLCKKEIKTIINNTGITIIEHFHPSIWNCSVKGHLSPKEAWETPEVMYKVIQNRMKYLDKELSLINIRQGLTISKYAPKISIFRPATAKYLIKKYLNEFDIIFDPCSGYSGRLLGTCSLNKKYVGQDINLTTVKETNDIINFYNLNASVRQKDSLYGKGEYDCLFTCPPYADKEYWFQDIEIFSAERWIDKLLSNYRCKKYLFIVDNPGKYKDYVVEEIQNASPLNKKKEYVVLIERK